MSTLKLEIPGLTHEQERTVEELLTRRPGVYCAVANHGEACVEVDFEDDEESLDQLVALLRDAGFEARLGG